jgi:hypothetical protein
MCILSGRLTRLGHPSRSELPLREYGVGLSNRIEEKHFFPAKENSKCIVNSEFSI